MRIAPGGPPWTIDASGCWVWDLVVDDKGYGHFGDRCLAHRWVYERFVGPIPTHLEIDHLCRNRACVNPAHLEPVTRAENIRRGLRQKVTPEMAALICASPLPGRTIAKHLGLGQTTISRVRRRG
jgi:hypothetical protein